MNVSENEGSEQDEVLLAELCENGNIGFAITYGRLVVPLIPL